MGRTEAAEEGGGEDPDSSFQMTSEQFPDLSQQTARARGRFAPQGMGSSGGGNASFRGTVGGGAGGRFAASRSAALTAENFPALAPGSGGGGGGGSGGFGGAFLNALIPRGGRIYDDRDRWSYPEVDIKQGKGNKKKKKGGGGGGGGVLTASTPNAASSSSGSSSVPLGPRPTGQGLQEEIQSLIGEAAFAELRDISRQLRTGALTGEEYYDGVVRLVPLRIVRLRVMADLLDLLPDEGLKTDIRALMDARDGAGGKVQKDDNEEKEEDEEDEEEERPVPSPPRPAFPSLGEASSSQQPTPKPKPKKKPQAAPSRSNGWAKALASASGSSGPTLVPKGRKPAGITIVRFKGGATSDGERPEASLFGERGETADAGGGGGPPGLGDNFPSLSVALPRPAGGGWVGKAARDAEEDNPYVSNGAGGAGGGKKKKQQGKKRNELQLAAFNFK